jgi:hypothetical protein
MRRMTVRAAFRAAALAVLFTAPVFTAPLFTASAVQAQPSPAAPPIGAEVKDSKGAAVGKVEKVILGPDGRPRQVLVRVDRVLRTLPVEALQPSGKAYAAVLTRAEIAALPPAD